MFEEEESTLDCVISLTLNDKEYTKEVKGTTLKVIYHDKIFDILTILIVFFIINYVL